MPPRACGTLGHLIIRPPARDRIPPGRSIPWCSVSCPRCVPYWEVNQAAKHLPPWDKIWTEPGVRLACPACRSTLTTSWAAINKFQKKVLSKPDGRIDPGEPTIKALSGVICDSPAVPLGRLGLVAQPNQIAGGAPVPAVDEVVAAAAILDARANSERARTSARAAWPKARAKTPVHSCLLQQAFRNGQ
jgi:hypothetical protein